MRIGAGHQWNVRGLFVALDAWVSSQPSALGLLFRPVMSVPYWRQAGSQQSVDTMTGRMYSR
jgi:hypothetical protein